MPVISGWSLKDRYTLVCTSIRKWSKRFLSCSDTSGHAIKHASRSVRDYHFLFTIFGKMSNLFQNNTKAFRSPTRSDKQLNASGLKRNGLIITLSRSMNAEMCVRKMSRASDLGSSDWFFFLDEFQLSVIMNKEKLDIIKLFLFYNRFYSV